MTSEHPHRWLVAWLATSSPPAAKDDAEAGARVDAAIRHGLAGVLDGALSAAGAPAWPEAARTRLREAHRHALYRNTQHLAAAARTLERLSSRGLRCLPLKGAALAEWLYDSVGERTMADVDLLVLGDWPAAVAALEADGYVEIARGDHDRCYREPDSQVVVELHHSVTSCPGFFPVDAEGLWERRQRGRGMIAERPSGEDLLVQLALHAAFQHGFAASLVQYLDVRRLLERHPLDVDQVVALARDARAAGALALTLEAARALVAAPVPPSLEEALAASAPASLRGWLRTRLAAPEGLLAPSRPPLARVRWQLARGRRRELIRRTLAPREPGQERSLWTELQVVVGRVAGLIRRWGPGPRASA